MKLNIANKLYFLFLPVLVFANCGDFSLFSQLSQPMTVVVYNTDQKNTNKTNAKSAVEIWAVTTKYETSGHESEKVMLTDQGDGTWSGTLYLPSRDDSYIILFDDVQTKQIGFDLPHQCFLINLQSIL